ncbi:MAG TPA: hypothetical protein VLT51_01725, partial [Anaerolineales bacterium]|nr:hypothetical protein [Anaerolineales bacterium]
TITTPDGITYTLSIPAGALDDVTTISLIPIQSIDGLPFSGGLLGAVRIEPEGIFFDLPATLTITRADGAPIPPDMLNLTFTFEGPGLEFHLHPFTPEDAYALAPGAPHLASLAAKPRLSGSDGGISVSNAQSYGAAAGTQQEARAVMENHPPTDSDSNISNIVAYAQQAEEEDLAPLPTRAQMAQATLAQVGEVNWSDLKKTLNKLENLQKIKDPKIQDMIEKIWDALLERLNKMLQHNKDECLTRDDFDAHAIVSSMNNAKKGSFLAQMANRFKQKFGDSTLKQVEENAKSCILNLVVDSKITADTPPVKFIVHVQGTIMNLKFNFKKGKTFLSGEGVVQYEPIQVIPNGNTPRSYCDPWVPLNEISATLKVLRLEPIFYPRTADSEGGALTDFKLSFLVTDNGRPKFKVTCTDIDTDGKKTVSTHTAPLNYGKGSIWGGVFSATHMNELVGTRAIFGWDILYDKSLPRKSAATDRSNHPIYAKYVIDSPNLSPGYGTWSETTKFLLTNSQ